MSSLALGNDTDKAHEIVVEPVAADVLLGRGKRAVNWRGNVRFRGLVKAWASEYGNSTDPHTRDNIANRIMGIIREEGGRFLQLLAIEYVDRQPKTWVVITETSARTKVKQALRDAMKMVKKPQTAAKVAAQRRQEDHSVDLEPRSIEEIMRTSSSSSTRLYPQLSLEAMLVQPQPQQQQQQQYHPPSSLPAAATRLQNLLPHGVLKRDEDSSEAIPYYPIVVPPSSTADDFRSILRLQQDILSHQLTTRPSHDAVEARFIRYHNEGSVTSAAPIERISMDAASLGPDRRQRLDLRHGIVVGDSLHSTSSDYMIGRAAAPQPASQHHSTTVFLDAAIRDQLKVDERKRPPSDEQSTFGSFFEDQGQLSSLSGADDDQGKDISAAQQQQKPHETHGDPRQHDV